MLVLGRTLFDSITLQLPNGDTIKVIQLAKGRWGIEAPKSVKVVRSELIHNK